MQYIEIIREEVFAILEKEGKNALSAKLIVDEVELNYERLPEAKKPLFADKCDSIRRFAESSSSLIWLKPMRKTFIERYNSVKIFNRITYRNYDIVTRYFTQNKSVFNFHKFSPDIVL